MHRLARLRAELIAEQAAGRRDYRFDRCNAIRSMVTGGEYPLAGIRRDRVQTARDKLAALFEAGNDGTASPRSG